MLFDCNYLICWGFQGMFYLWLGVATIQLLRFLTIFQQFLWMARNVYPISRHAQISPWISVYVPIPLAKYQNTWWILDTCPTICFFLLVNVRFISVKSQLVSNHQSSSSSWSSSSLLLYPSISTYYPQFVRRQASCEIQCPTTPVTSPSPVSSKTSVSGHSIAARPWRAASPGW